MSKQSHIDQKGPLSAATKPVPPAAGKPVARLDGVIGGGAIGGRTATGGGARGGAAGNGPVEHEIGPAGNELSLLDGAIALFPYVLFLALVVPVYLTWWQTRSPLPASIAPAPSTPAPITSAPSTPAPGPEVPQVASGSTKEDFQRLQGELQAILEKLSVLESAGKARGQVPQPGQDALQDDLNQIRRNCQTILDKLETLEKRNSGVGRPSNGTDVPLSPAAPVRPSPNRGGNETTPGFPFAPDLGPGGGQAAPGASTTPGSNRGGNQATPGLPNRATQ